MWVVGVVVVVADSDIVFDVVIAMSSDGIDDVLAKRPSGVGVDVCGDGSIPDEVKATIAHPDEGVGDK